MKKFLSSRGGAAVFCAVIMVLSIYFGAYKSLGTAARAVQDSFSTGVEYKDNGKTYVHESIRSQLINRAEACTSMVSYTHNFEEVSEQNSSLRSAVNNLKDLLYNKGTPSQLCSADKALDSAFSALVAALDGIEFDSADTRNIEDVISEMNGTAEVIKKSGYNEYVYDFNNRVLSVFPANFLKKICFIAPPEPYEQELVNEI